MEKNLVSEEDIKKIMGPLNIFGGSLFAKAIMNLMKLNKINKLYSDAYNENPEKFLETLIKKLKVVIDVNSEELKRIPLEGPFITVSNHPFGGLDGIILIMIISKIRPDYKVMANFLLKKIEPIKDYFLGVNPFENRNISSASGIKDAILHISSGKPLGIFPAGEVSSYRADADSIGDKEWSPSVLKLIKSSKVPVVPIYFKGANSLLFQILGVIHPMLRTAKLPSELLNKKNKVVYIRIGNPIPVKTQESMVDIVQYGKFLRAKTYLLASPLKVKKFFIPNENKEVKAEKIIDAVDPKLIKEEIEEIKKDYLLFDMKNFSIFCAPTVKIPRIMEELGRLREITFRAVGEGTNRSTDVDEYDLYYNHLFIYDRTENKIVGAYRLGKGKDIMERYGIKGFYVNSLFKIRKPLYPLMRESIELGRSFITKEYQKKPLPLFMLWKGIIYFLIKHPEYRYLLGPVSISGKFTSETKELIMKFIIKNHWNADVAKYISPRSKYKVETNDKDIDVLLDASNDDIKMLDRAIVDIESDKIPVLLKKYISLNGKIVSFNIDPLFNMCLDGLLLLDLYDIPPSFIESLSKEIKDDTILTRFSNTDF